MTTRAEHLARAKQRALEYVDAGDLPAALASIGSDLDKHPETRDHPGTTLGLMLMINGSLSTADDMRRFIEGYN
jgi:hypothetical protein